MITSIRSKLISTVLTRGFAGVAAFDSITFNRYGYPTNVLEPSQSQTGVVKDSDVLIEMMYAPISPADISTIKGFGKNLPKVQGNPLVAGNEGVGVVKEVGSAVKGLRKGDLVVPAKPYLGTWTKRSVVAESQLFKVPRDISPEVIASVAANAATAVSIIKEFKIQPKEVVLIDDANGPLGLPFVQIASAKGIKVICIMSGSTDYINTATALKAAGGLAVIDENFVDSQSFKEAVKAWAPKYAVRTGKSMLALQGLIDSLPKGGTLINVDGMGSSKKLSQQIQAKGIDMKAFNLAKWLESGNGTKETLGEVLDMIKKGSLTPRTSKFKFTNFNLALEVALAKGVDGSLLLQF